MYLAQLGHAVEDAEPMADPMPTFAANLRRLREQQGISQEGLAHASDLNPSHLAKIERCEREPGVRTVSKIALALRVAANDLFDGIDGRSQG